MQFHYLIKGGSWKNYREVAFREVAFLDSCRYWDEPENRFIDISFRIKHTRNPHGLRIMRGSCWSEYFAISPSYRAYDWPQNMYSVYGFRIERRERCIS